MVRLVPIVYLFPYFSSLIRQPFLNRTFLFFRQCRNAPGDDSSAKRASETARQALGARDAKARIRAGERDEAPANRRRCHLDVVEGTSSFIWLFYDDLHCPSALSG